IAARPALPLNPLMRRSRSSDGATYSFWCSSARGTRYAARFRSAIAARSAARRCVCSAGVTSALLLHPLRRLGLREPGEIQAEELRAHLLGDLRIAPLLLQLGGHLEIAEPVDDARHVVEREVEPADDLVRAHPLQRLADHVVAAVGRALEPADDAGEA